MKKTVGEILLRMKLSIALLLLTFLHVSAKVHSQDRITLTEKGITWAQLFDVLQKKSSYTFVYKDDVLPRQSRIDVDVVERTVPQILENLMRNSPLTYQVLTGNLVVITARLAAPGDVRVTGTVTGTGGDVLVGASIKVKGASTGTSTDTSGNFSLMAPEGATLVISFIGYQTQEIPLSGRTQLTVSLQATPGNINEVVVIGYGTSRKKSLTGAVSTIRSQDINNLPVGDVSQIMQGKAAGVAITQSTGAPGTPINVRIRGVGTINNNDPLYIIDGVPTKEGINALSPNDIDDITILKDASASIYGARASNGVVLVTTRKGKSGKPRFSFNAYTGVQTPGRYIPMTNARQYATAYNTAATNDKSNRPLISDAELDTLPDIDYQRAVMKSAMMTNLQMSVSGGSENTQYMVSAAYLKQDGMIKNSSYDRLSIRSSVTSTLSRMFKFGMNLNLAFNKTRQVGSSGDGFGDGNPGASVVRYALFRTPQIPIFNPDGSYLDLPATDVMQKQFGDGLNPVGLAANTDRNFYNYSVLGDAFLEITPVKGLKIRSDLGTNLILQEYKQFFPTWGGPVRYQNLPNSLAQSYANNFTYNWTNTATYGWNIGDHSFEVMAGTEAISNDVRQLSASRTDFVDQGNDFRYLSNGTLNPLNGGVASQWSLFSFFGRANYSYNEKYIASVNFRRDGSSRLDPRDRWGNFISGSVGWRLDKEKFLEDVKDISLLKLRASVGQLGNQEIPSYAYTSIIQATGGYYPFGGVSSPAYSITAKGNPNVKWETSIQTDIGVDLGLFNNAVTITADYYNKKTSNMLLSIPSPSSGGGASNPYQNAGTVINRGFELEASYRKTISKDWRYEVSANLATVHNEVTSLADGRPIPAGRIDNNLFGTLTTAGQPIGAFYLLQMDGLFQNPLEVFTHAYQGPGIMPGDVKFRDINHDGVIDQRDRVFAGSPIPRLSYGFTGNVAWKDLDLTVFFQGVSGNKIYNQVLTDIEGFYRPFNLTERAATRAWTGEGSTNEFPRLSWTGAQNNKQASTRFLQSGSYLRLKNLQVGYRVNPAVTSRWKVSGIRVFASVQNLFTVTKYTGLDPEMGTSANGLGDGDKAVGIDWGTYPSARTFTAGVNINF